MWTLQAVIVGILWHAMLGMTFTQPDECEHIQGKMSIEDDLRFFFIGESASLTCHIDSSIIQDFNVANFNIKVNKCGEITDFKPNSVNKSGIVEIRVQDPIVNLPCKQKLLDYVCYYEVKENSMCFLKERQLIYFEYPPSSVKGFTCLVYNWKNMTCLLDMGVVYRQWNQSTFNKVDIKVKAGIMNGYLSSIPVQQNGSVAKIEVPEDYFYNLMYEIRINITNNARNVYKESCFKFNTRTFVKPAKISSLNLAGKATVMNLSWKHSNTQMWKVFRVCYSSEYKSTQKCQLGAPNEYNMTLVDLWPHTIYKITIDVRPLFPNKTETGFWSEKYLTTSKTKEDVPVDVPKFWPGFFTQTDDEDKVIIYWKPISKENSCGIITYYRITIIEIVPFGEQENKTVINDIPPHSISYELSLETQKKYEIKLTQKTSVGYPRKKKDAHIYIFPPKMRPTLSDNLNIQAVTNTSIEFQWKTGFIDQSNQLDDIVTYHISWCKRDIMLMNGQCIRPINSKIVPAIRNRTSYKMNIDLNSGEHYYNYQFGISVEGTNKPGWFISSGIRWYTDCIYLQRGVPKTALIFEVPQDVEVENGIYVKWKKYSCHESIGKIESYLISYCNADSTKLECQGNVRNISVVPSSSSYTIEELARGKTYVMKIRTKMESGEYGPWSNSERVLFKYVKTIDKGSGEDILLVAAVIGSVALVSIILAAVYFGRRYLRKQAEEVSEIIMPPLTMRNLVDNTQANGSEGDTRESRQPLLTNSARDSGLGGSSTNGNSQNSLDKKYSSYNGVGFQGSHSNQNSNKIHSPVVESPEFSENKETSTNCETSFNAACGSGETETTNSEGYRDIDLCSSEDESSDNDSSSVQSDNCSSSNTHEHHTKIKGDNSVQNSHCDGENKAFQDENSERTNHDISCIDSYCCEAETSVDSYCQQGYEKVDLDSSKSNI